MTIPILIPAYKPNKLLIELIDKLIELGCKDIIVVNDGSGVESTEIFKQIEDNRYCHLCTHAVNLGKGRALKTGFNFAISNYAELGGIVTADADGQHSPEDILRIHNKILEHTDNLIIGCRGFDKKIPWRSKIGNETTKKVFHLLTGVKLSDTQTGLRGIPSKYLPECMKMDGEKYEYEINMLVTFCRRGVSLIEVPIKTIYIDENSSSHFNPIFDSIKIYFVLFRFLLSSLSTSFFDFIVFIVCSNSGMSILLSTIIARAIAGNYNFFVNKKIVFKSQSNFMWSFVKYWLLVLLLASISYLGITTLVSYLAMNLFLSKALIETLLFFISFAVQSKLVFNPVENFNEKN